MSDPILIIKDLADYLKVNERTIYCLAASGKLPGFKVGSSWRFKHSELEQYIAAQHNHASVSEAIKSPNSYFLPVMGLIFLRDAYSREIFVPD